MRAVISVAKGVFGIETKVRKLQEIDRASRAFSKKMLLANRSKVDARFSKWTHENDTFRETKILWIEVIQSILCIILSCIILFDFTGSPRSVGRVDIHED